MMSEPHLAGPMTQSPQADMRHAKADQSDNGTCPGSLLVINSEAPGLYNCCRRKPEGVRGGWESIGPHACRPHIICGRIASPNPTTIQTVRG
jgi:hypothetical protein